MSATQSRQIVTVEFGDLTIPGCVIFRSKYDGFDPLSKKRIKAGDLIAYKHKDKLTERQRQTIWPNGQYYNLTVHWPLQAANPTATSFTPSEYQKQIWQSLSETDDHIIIQALAGSGKTATLVWLVQELEKHGLAEEQRCLYMAFGKRDQLDLADRLSGMNVEVLTTHSFGFRVLKKVFGSEIQPKNTHQHCGDIFIRLICDVLGLSYTAKSFKQARDHDDYALRANIIELVGYIKNWALFPHRIKGGYEFDAQQQETIQELIHMYEIEPTEDWKGDYTEWKKAIIKYACEIVCLSIPVDGQQLFEISFDDMLYLPLALDLELPYYDLLLTDESQDFNACQVLLLERLQRVKKPG